MVTGLTKLTKHVSQSLSIPRKWQQQSLFSRLGGEEFYQAAELASRSGVNVPKRVAASTVDKAKRVAPDAFTAVRELLVPPKSGCAKQSDVYTYITFTPKVSHGTNGIGAISRRQQGSIVNLTPLLVTRNPDTYFRAPCFSRFISSKASEQRGQPQNETKKDISTVEDPFDSPTYNIPQKPVTFAEGASYSFIILAGLGVAAAAGYAVFKELIFQPKEYKIFDKALKRIQDDSQVRVRIGSPITGYGQESRNRAARQRIPNRIWTDEDGIERVEVNFYIRGPHGAGKVYTEMFKDQADKQWKYTYLIVEVKSPSPAQLILESYMPA